MASVAAISVIRDLSVFLSAALRRPGTVGAAAPSSRCLAEVLASVAPTSGRPTVVELGPGTGAVSAAISRRLPPGARHLAVEIDDRLADHMERSHPTVVVLRGDAADLDKLLARSRETPRTAALTRYVDAVVSGLPWSLFDDGRQRAVLDQVCRALRPEGAFTTFAYPPMSRGGKRFRGLLHSHFAEVIVTRTVWRNVPPALVYVCHRPTQQPTHS